MMTYVNLHAHSQYSALDGHLLIDHYVARLLTLGHQAAALTDHGTLSGIPVFHSACLERQICPIIGLEAYVAPSGRGARDKNNREQYHLTLLAMNAEGYRNLMMLSTIAHLEGFYHKPRIDHEVLARYHSGLICLSGCIASETSAAILAGDEDRAREIIDLYRDIFDDRYFLEIQEHGDEFPEQRIVNQALFRIAYRDGIRLVPTNDVHFCTAADRAAQQTLLGVNTASQSDEERIKGSPYTYIRDNEEMAQTFDPGLLQTTQEIATWVESYPLGSREPRLPISPLERPDQPAALTLATLAQLGLESRLGQPWAAIDARYRDRLLMEIGVIRQLSDQLGADFSRYLLLVKDVCDFARRQSIRFGPRGSAAGSVICWALGISEPDPISHGLYFERFLNPHRIELPDIDLDFADDRRDEIFSYLEQTYGHEQVARIVTFSTFGAHGAIRAAARYKQREIVNNNSALWLADELSRLIPDDPRPGGIPLEEVLDPQNMAGAALQDRLRRDPEADMVISHALHLVGRISSVGTHPAGVVIADRPVREIVPLMQVKNEKRATIAVQTQYEMGQLEQLGLLKIDVLGLSALAIFDRCLDLIKEQTGIQLNPWDFPLDDPQAWEVIQRGHVLGLFQIGSTALSRAVIQLKPDSLSDLALTIAVYRPGPMANLTTIAHRKHGQEPVVPLHPDIDPILASTYGIPVFQEQIMEIVQIFAGYSLAEADLLRKAIGKKKRDLMEREWEHFARQAAALGRSQSDIQMVWDFIVPFADYGFNKAHAVCYAYLAFQSAYLKAHFPEMFYAAAMTVEARGGSQEHEPPQVRVGALIREARERQVTVLPPSVQEPVIDFTPVGNHLIRYGLTGIKGIATKAAVQLVEQAPFMSLGDLVMRCPDLDKTSLLVLAQVGAIPWHHRASLVRVGPLTDKLYATEGVEELLRARQRAKGRIRYREKKGIQLEMIDRQAFLTPPETSLPELPEHSMVTILAWEQQRMGMFREMPVLDEGLTITPVHQLPDHVGRTVSVAGVITQVKPHIARKSGQEMGYGRIMDNTGEWNITLFPQVWKRCKRHMVVGNFVVVNGKVTQEADGYDLFVHKVIRAPIKEADDLPKEVVVHDPDPLGTLAEIFQLADRLPGDKPVRILFPDRVTSQVVFLSPEASPELWRIARGEKIA